MKTFALALSLLAISATATLHADPLATDYTTNVSIGTTPSSTGFDSGYSVESFSLTGTDTVNFSNHNSVTFLLSADHGLFTYDAPSTDSYWSFSLTFGSSSAGMVSPASYAITFLDDTNAPVAVTYDSTSVVMGSNDTYPNGVCVSAEFYNLTQSFSFTSIRIDMDYTGFSGGTVSAQDISLTSGGMQCWSAASSYTSMLTFTAVPEPATCAGFLGVASLGVAGFVRRRRRK